MAKVILRVAKLKTRGNISASLSHSFRTRETPNADPAKMALNSFSHSAPPDLAAAIQERMPEKFRKDAVRCLEYFVGASPEWFSGRQDGERYFRDALDWLKKQHGEENLAGWAIHRDEKSPHLVAYFVPLDEGKLNAKRWTGGREKLSKMQTDFAAQVGQKHGLERGIEGSKAKHQTVKQFYAALGQEMKFTLPRAPKMPPPLSGFKRISPIALQDRVDFLTQALEHWQTRAAKLQQLIEQANARVQAYELAKKTADLAVKEKNLMATEVRKTAKVQWELRKTQGALREAKEALQEAHRETDMAKDELGGAEKELAALRPQKGVLTKGDCALILGDKWAKENLGEIKDRLNMAREPAPPEWAELAKKKIQEETRANQKSSPAPRPGG
jgi:hypothetical protein